MKIALLTTVDIEYEVHKDFEDALWAADKAGVNTTHIIEGFIQSIKMRPYDVVIIDHIDEGRCPRMWEQYADTNIVIFPDRVEMRYFEDLEPGKYITHTEVFPGPVNEEQFLTGFYLAIALDRIDVRKAVRMGVKRCVSQAPSVVR